MQQIEKKVTMIQTLKKKIIFHRFTTEIRSTHSYESENGSVNLFIIIL